MSEYLNLFYEEKLVGILKEDDEERLSFQYQKSWLENDQSFSISIALELDSRTFSHIETKSFFENLLPEGEIKSTLESLSKKNISDEFNFLKEFGIDCAGALILSPNEKIKLPDTYKSKEIELSKIYQYLHEKKTLTSTIINEEGGRFSLAGAQDKFPVIYKNKNLFIPLNGEPTTHILKPYARYHKDTEDTPYNEHFCMLLAKSVGLNVPTTILIDGEYPLYLVERFDRKRINNKTFRIHQQDFCQAQGLTSRKKYEDDGGPTFADNYKLISKVSCLPLKDLSQLLNWFWFNLLIGNNDCHSKNLSLLHTDQGIRLSPFYDLLCTSIYKGLTSRFSYKIGKQLLWHKLKERNLELLAGELGISPVLLLKTGKNMIKKINEKSTAMTEEFNGTQTGVITAKKIKSEIEKRSAHLKKNIKGLDDAK